MKEAEEYFNNVASSFHSQFFNWLKLCYLLKVLPDYTVLPDCFVAYIHLFRERTDILRIKYFI